MKNDPCAIATSFAESMSKAATIVDLKATASEIKAHIEEVADWREWLLTVYASKMADLTAPKLTKDDFNAAGKKAIDRGDIMI